MQQRIFTSEKLEPLFIFTLLLRTNKLVNQLNSLFHRKSSTVWFWRSLWTNRAESRHAQILSEDSALSQDYDHEVSRRTKHADAVLAGLHFGVLEAETEHSVRTSGQRVARSLSTNRQMEKKEFESEPLGSHKALEVGRVVPVSALLSDAGAQKWEVLLLLLHNICNYTPQDTYKNIVLLSLPYSHRAYSLSGPTLAFSNTRTRTIILKAF